MKWLKRFGLILIVGIGLLLYFNYPKLNIIAGYSAKYMASQTYLANRKPLQITKQDLNAPLIKYASTLNQPKNKETVANVFNILSRKAKYREGLGAVLLPKNYELKPSAKPKRQKLQDSLPYPFGHLPPQDTLFDNIDYDQLNKAIAIPFTQQQVQKTRSLLVLYKGHLLFEKYANDITKDTPVLGWSMTKSVLATCFGILEKQGKIEVNWQAPISQWQNDTRKNITINHLLRMQSGLAWQEDYTKISDVTQMLFLDADMTQAQKQQPVIAAPAKVWNYSSGTSNLLSGILRQQFRTHQEYLNFPYQALLDKIGAHSFLMETDAAGNFVGSSYGWATTRDWGRLGQLYLNKGNWKGEEIFKPSWIDYITKPTQNSNGTYGAHFWLNAHGAYPNVPKDLYSMNGYEGQYVFIIPSKDLVVVRTGLAETPNFKANQFLSMLCKAIH